MIYIVNNKFRTAKSQIYLGNVGSVTGCESDIKRVNSRRGECKIAAVLKLYDLKLS